MPHKPLFRLVPPVGDPIAVSDLLRAGRWVWSQDQRRKFLEALMSYLEVKHCFLVSSGTAALYLIFKALRNRTQRDEVIIPAYSCPSLVAAAARANLKIRLCDISRSHLGLDLDSLGPLLSERTLCVVVVHLFGIPGDTKSVAAMAAERGALVVEDSAQAFGATSEERRLGTEADIGLYSFGRGKPLSVLGGGAIVTNRNDLADSVGRYVKELPADGVLAEMTSLAKTNLYSLLIHPYLYWIPNSLPFLKLGQTRYAEDFRVHSMNGYHASLARILVFRNDVLLRQCTERSAALKDQLMEFADGSTYSVPGVAHQIPYLRLPVIITSPVAREETLRRLVRKGIGATRMYGACLVGIPGVLEHLHKPQEYPNADHVASRLLTLPVSSLLTERDSQKIVGVFRRVFERRSIA